MVHAMRRYVFPASVEQVPSGGYSLFFEDLPGCITGAVDMTTLAARAQEALELHLEGMLIGGETIPEPTPPERLPTDGLVATLLVEAVPGGSEQVTIELSSELLKRADERAGESGRTRASFISDQVERLLAAE